MNSAPSVAMIEGTRPIVTSSPLSAPIKVPTSNDPASGTQNPPAAIARFPNTKAQTASTEPTETSISAVRITWFTARPTIAMMIACSRMEVKFSTAKNPLVVSEKATTSKPRKSAAGVAGLAKNVQSHSRDRAAEATDSAMQRSLRSRRCCSDFFGTELAAAKFLDQPAFAHNQCSVTHREDFV